jgi:hypothetical protein
MTHNRVVMVAPEHLRTALFSCQNVQLHAIIEKTVYRLPMAPVVAKQCSRNAVVLSREPTGEAQGCRGLLRGVVICKTLTNEVEQGVGKHVFEYLIFLDGCRV